MKQTILITAIATISLVLGLWLSQKLDSGKLPTDLEATYLPQGKPLRPFQLVDHNGNKFDLARLKNKWTFVFFGYTNCPDVCPAALKIMQLAWDKMDAKTLKQAQLVFVSVDADRDPPAKLKEYVTYFHPDFIGVTGKPDQLDIITGSIGVLYGFEDPEPGSKEYHVNHSAQIILIDPASNMRAVFSPPHDAESIARTFKQILSYSN
ncbi:MAG: SCO family protein [Gammaproteobacteria bacterium]|nr:SCO family protein [Gammaproteobacteria bacterium]MDH5778203.1 SCO family protein [Gammaproteobacteria bacterium]